MVHSQIIIRDLISTIISEIKAPMQVIRLEGDAIFLYVDKGDPFVRWEIVQPMLFEITWRDDIYRDAPQKSEAAAFGTLGITYRARKPSLLL